MLAWKNTLQIQWQLLLAGEIMEDVYSLIHAFLYFSF